MTAVSVFALLSLLLGQYLVKLALAALDTIPFYLLTRQKEGPPER